MSAKAPSNEAAVKGFEKGSTDFLAKPFCSKVLVNKVRVALQVAAYTHIHIMHTN